MARVAWLAGLAERSRECDGERLIQGEADGDPQAQGSALSLAELDLADPCLIDADEIGELAAP